MLLSYCLSSLSLSLSPRRVLVRVAASSGGGTSVGPGRRWRPSGPTKGCAARSDYGRAALWALNDAGRPGWRPAVAIGGPDLTQAEGIIDEGLLESIEEAGAHRNVEHVDWSAARGSLGMAARVKLGA